jgi:hypothetical protein
MLTERLSEIRARLEKATPGEWGLKECSHGGAIVTRDGSQSHIQIVPLGDAEIFAHAPADLRFLLRVVEKVQEWHGRSMYGWANEATDYARGYIAALSHLMAEIEDIAKEAGLPLWEWAKKMEGGEK